MEDLRRGLRLDRALQNAIRLAGERVDLRFIGERKPIGGIVMMIVLVRVSRRLGEAMIERAKSAHRRRAASVRRRPGAPAHPH
jgi:hypothetical protein